MTPAEILITASIKKYLSEKVRTISHLAGGGWANVYKVSLAGGQTLVAKLGHPGFEHLSGAEAGMLTYLADYTTARFPKVMGEGDGVLLLNFIENDGRKEKAGEREAGRMLATLHTTTSDKFGFAKDTIFGPTRQPNPWGKDWVSFFRDQRLLYMTTIAYDAGKIDIGLCARLEALCSKLENHLQTPDRVSLLHGDFWGGNVLFNQSQCAGFIDPAIYFGDPETDLAFATLFGSLGEEFFAGYAETYKIKQGFFEERLDIYNLWPLLFHAYWFGGHYVGGIDTILKKLGY